MTNFLFSRRTIIISSICILGMILIIMSLWFRKPKFISQSMDNLEKVIIIFEPYLTGKNRVVYTNERSEMEHVYGLLNMTVELRTYKYPNHSKPIQWDSDIAVYLEYRNGDKDEFFDRKNGGIVRFLSTRGNSNDPGYILGSNEKLLEQIINISWCD